MSRSKVKQDVHGLYVRKEGFIFRPIFPVGFEVTNPDVTLNVGDYVKCTYNGSAAYARLVVDGDVLYWMKHGTYIIPDGNDLKHIRSSHVILPSNKADAETTDGTHNN